VVPGTTGTTLPINPIAIAPIAASHQNTSIPGATVTR
jgi:hypothetical protein